MGVGGRTRTSPCASPRPVGQPQRWGACPRLAVPSLLTPTRCHPRVPCPLRGLFCFHGFHGRPQISVTPVHTGSHPFAPSLREEGTDAFQKQAAPLRRTLTGPGPRQARQPPSTRGGKGCEALAAPRTRADGGSEGGVSDRQRAWRWQPVWPSTRTPCAACVARGHPPPRGVDQMAS